MLSLAYCDVRINLMKIRYTNKKCNSTNKIRRINDNVTSCPSTNTIEREMRERANESINIVVAKIRANGGNSCGRFIKS